MLREHANSTQKDLSWVQNQKLHAVRQNTACVKQEIARMLGKLLLHVGCVLFEKTVNTGKIWIDI